MSVMILGKSLYTKVREIDARIDEILAHHQLTIHETMEVHDLMMMRAELELETRTTTPRHVMVAV